MVHISNMLSNKNQLTKEERAYIRLVMDQFKKGLVITAEILSDEEIALCIKEAIPERIKGLFQEL
jgi:uncharacterized membrane-anchored protein